MVDPVNQIPSRADVSAPNIPSQNQVDMVMNENNPEEPG